jgi:hypothetical protein
MDAFGRSVRDKRLTDKRDNAYASEVASDWPSRGEETPKIIYIL